MSISFTPVMSLSVSRKTWKEVQIRELRWKKELDEPANPGPVITAGHGPSVEVGRYRSATHVSPRDWNV